MMAAKSKNAAEAVAMSYGKPPILEAVIEFRFDVPLTEREIGKWSGKVGRAYDSSTHLKEVQFEVNAEQGTAAVKGDSSLFRHTSEDQTEIFIIKASGVSWSRLAPYEGWEPFLARARREFEISVGKGPARRISRLGVRYINRIDVPLDEVAKVFRFEDYLSVYVNLPPLMVPVQHFEWRVDKVFPEQGFRSMIHSATFEAEIPGTAAFLLDIDVSIEQDVPIKLEEIFTKLAEMRTLKNTLFESSITDLARQSFNT